MTKLYLDIVAALQATGSFKHIGTYNSDDVSLDDEIHFATPAVFIAFKNIKYNTLPMGYQEAEGDIWIRTIKHTLKPNGFDIYTLAKVAHRALHRLKDVENEYATIIREGATQNQNFKGYESFDQWYYFRVLERPVEDLVYKIIPTLQHTVSFPQSLLEFNDSEFNKEEFY